MGDDGSFSSAGAYGFYSWSDATKHSYGIVARQERGREEYLESVLCGRLIRKAFVTCRP